MTREEKTNWMIMWAHKNQCVLTLEGECGFGRECVGILADGKYPDYEWHDKEWNRADKNGDVWTPEDAYHKHPCVAVLGRGERAEEQLYQWLKWFDENNFKLEVFDKDLSGMSQIDIIFGGITDVRMVKGAA